MLRLAAMAGTALTLAAVTTLSGAYVGAMALSAGVLAEAAAAGRMAQGAVRALSEGTAVAPRQRLTMRRMAAFYVPLAMSSILALGIQPLVTFFMGQSRMAVESLAVLPVITGLTFVFRSLGLSFQETGIALLGPQLEEYRPLRTFAIVLALGTSAGLALIAFTPLAIVWFQGISGLSAALTAFAVPPLRIMTPLAALSVWLSLQRSILVTTRRTTTITWASSAEMATTTAILWIGIEKFNAVGVMSAAVALVAGRCLTIAWLALPSWRATRT